METRNCKIHGDYQLKEIEVMGKLMSVGRCKQCDEIEKKEKEEKEKAKEYKYAVRRRRDAGIGNRTMFAKFSDYKADTGSKQEHAKKTFMRLSEAIVNNGTTFNIIASGGVGTGKTLLASALIESVIDERVSARIIKCIDLIRSLKETWSKKCEFTEREIIEKYSNLDLLIIDEIGVQFGSDTEKLFIFDIIDGRYQNMLPTVLISNRPIDQIKEEVGDRVIDRLREDGGTLVIFDWESARVKQ